MSLHGFWNKNGQKLVRKTQFNAPALRAAPGTLRALDANVDYETWRDHPDTAAVARALVAKCQLPKVSQ